MRRDWHFYYASIRSNNIDCWHKPCIQIYLRNWFPPFALFIDNQYTNQTNKKEAFVRIFKLQQLTIIVSFYSAYFCYFVIKEKPPFLTLSFCDISAQQHQNIITYTWTGLKYSERSRVYNLTCIIWKFCLNPTISWV